jgi:hypothetical protein
VKKKMNLLDKYPDVLNVNDLQAILGIGRQQAYELVASNAFHTVRVGRSIKILKEVLISWLRGEDQNTTSYSNKLV